MTLQRRLQLLIVGVTAVLATVVTAMVITLARFEHDAARRDRLAVAQPAPPRATLTRAIEQGARTRRTFVVTVAVATGAAASLLVVGAVLLRRWVTVPIGRLHADLDAVGDGDLHHPIRSTGARDLAELGAAAERMRTRILRQRDAVERADEAVDQDLPAVAALRRLLAPATAAAIPGLDVAATLLPAEGVLAGDWYDLVDAGERLFISIGDVCGHGASTGIAAVRTKFALLDSMHLGSDPDAALRLAAGRFGESNDFVTCTVIELDPVAGVGRYANAGHPPALIVTPLGGSQSLDPTGALIGPFPGDWQSRGFELGVGDTLVMYSDGVSEARDDTGHELGTDAIVRAVAATAGASASATLEALMAMLFRHCPDGFVDDITIVVARRTAATA